MPSKNNYLYNKNNPKSRSIFTDDNPTDTINIKYTTYDDVIKTIKKLERLYKQKKYTHQRISSVGLILKIRLELLKNTKKQHYELASRYLEFLKQRTKLNQEQRYKLKFQI